MAAPLVSDGPHEKGISKVKQRGDVVPDRGIIQFKGDDGGKGIGIDITATHLRRDSL